jgi:membrane-associated phospholipid phosphatase
VRRSGERGFVERLRARVALLVSLVLVLTFSGSRAWGDDDEKPKKKLHWEEGRRRFHPVEYVVTGIVGPFSIGEYFLAPAQSQPKWVGGILFDDAIRDALRMRSPQMLNATWAMADSIGVTLVALSVGLDSIIIPLARGSTDVTWQLVLMDAESFSLSSLVAITGYDSIGRARPNYEDCLAGRVTVGCNGSGTASFPSGHINEAFTAAGLSCAHHLFQHIYGNAVADTFACVRDVTLGTTEAILRMMGDRHYFSDVVAGSIIGFSFGFAMPTLVHYMKWRHGPKAVVSPMIAPHVSGLMLGWSL